MFNPMMPQNDFDQRTLQEQLLDRKRDLEKRIAAVDRALTLIHDNPELERVFIVSKAILASII